MSALQHDPIRRVDLNVDTENVNEDDLISFTEAAKLVRGRNGFINRQVMQRHSNPRRGRVFVIAGVAHRLVLPSVARVMSRYTTVAWVEAWKKKYAELSERVRDEGTKAPPAPRERTARQARRGHERAMKNLRKLGFTFEGDEK